MSSTSQPHAINCHTPPSHPIPCHSSPSHPLPCHNSPSQPIPCHTSPSHSVLYHNSPSHQIPCRTSPSHSIPSHNSPSQTSPFHTLGNSKNKELCDNQPWHSSSTTDGAGSESDPGHGFNIYSRRLSARIGEVAGDIAEVAGDIAEVAGDIKDNSPAFDKTRRRLSARLCRVTVDMSENTEALLQHTINHTTSAIRRSLSTGNNYFSSSGLADNDLTEGAGNLNCDGGSGNVGNLDGDGGNVADDGEIVADERRERADSVGELSPQYDEGEDLESSIAKLRSLLEEKERTESGSFDSGHEDIAEIDIDLPPPAKDECKVPDGASSTAEATRGGFHNLPQENIPQMDLTKDTVPRPTLPEDGKLFMSVVIPSAEVQDQNMQQFVLYFIQYEGIFLAPASPPGTFEYIVQTCKVNRRFSEFLNLQNRLENNTKLKMFLKGIKGPSKWLTLPFAKVDKSFVASRRAVLERWLAQLCDIPVINVSQEIREFLAYGSDGSIAYLRKSGSSQRINQLRKIVIPGVVDVLHPARRSIALAIDMPGEIYQAGRKGAFKGRKNIVEGAEFLARTVTGVFNSLKDVLPSFEGDELSENVERPDKETKQGFFAFKSRTEEYQVIATFVPQPRSVGICEEDVMEYHLQQLQEWGEAMEAMEADQSPLLMGPRPQAQPVAQDPPRPPLSTDDLMEDDIPVAALLINLASSLVPTKTWMSSIALNRTAKILTGNIIQDAVQGLVSDYCSEAGHVKCIRFLLDFLWNQQQTSLDAQEFSQKWEATKTSLYACIGEDCVTTWRTILSNDAATLELILDVVDTILAHLVVNKEKHFLS